ncbi:MAG: aldose epimerase family protein [Paraclostridium sp.]
MNIYEKVACIHSGKTIIQYTLKNDNGISVSILNYGGIITGVYTPDKTGLCENIVVGFKDIKDYISNPSYFGAIIGRTSGRIYNSKFQLNNEIYNLSNNYGTNQGHGGNIGFDKKIWDTKLIKDLNSVSLELTTTSYDMEEGYPGNIEVKVTYTLDNDNRLNIDYEGISDKDTLMNLTNHTYFNLSGDLKAPITSQYMKVNSDYILEIDETCSTTGNKISTHSTPFDFKSLHNIGERIDFDDNQINIGCGYDHPFLLNNNRESAIYIEDINSSRYMNIDTNQNCVVIYSMNFTNDEVLYTNKISERRYGICFETQKPPIGHNQAFLEDSILRKGEVYKQNTTYTFGIL